MTTAQPRIELINSQEYKQFRSWVARQRVDVLDEGESWRYYDFGPKTDTVPVVLLGGICGTAESFFHQFVSLCPKGYRLIAAQPEGAKYTTHAEFARGLDALLNKLGIPKVHIFGCQLGGFLAQIFASRHPSRVASLVLCNAFCDTQYFVDNAPCAGALAYTPEFLLKRYVLAGLPQGVLPPAIADAIDFVAQEVDTSSKQELLTRVLLNCTAGFVDPRKTLPNDRVMIMISADRCVQPLKLREDVQKFYPDSRCAILRSGGDFPHISNPDEVNMMLEVHLRAMNATLSASTVAAAAAAAPSHETSPAQ